MNMREQTQLQKLLLLRSPSFEGEGSLSFLRQYFDVTSAETIEQAVDVMREAHFDAVLSEMADFLPLERAAVSQQAAVILDRIGDGVCVVGPQKELVWANQKAREFPADVLDSLRDICTRAYEEFAASPVIERGRRFSIMPEDGSSYEVVCSPIRDRQG